MPKLHFRLLETREKRIIDYDKVRESFVEWVYKKLDEKTAKDRIRYLDKYLSGLVITSIEDLQDILNGIEQGWNHVIKAIRSLVNFLDSSRKIDRNFADELRKILKTKREGFDSYIPSDEEVRTWLKRINLEKYGIVFKLLAYSGIRFVEGVYIISSFNPKKLHFEDEIAYYDLDWTRRTKKSFKAFMPAEFATELERIDIKINGVTSYFRKRGIKPKYLRKWNAMKLITAGVPTEVIDFIQGRVPQSVLQRHYLEKLNLSLHFYRKAIPTLREVIEF